MIVELPAYMCLRVFNPAYVYGFAVVCFGVFGASVAAATNYPGLIILRLFIGLGEAFVQTAFIFVTLWYKRDEIATRQGKLS